MENLTQHLMQNLMWLAVILAGIVAIGNAMLAARRQPAAPVVTVSPFRQPIKWMWAHFQRIPRKKRWMLWGVFFVIFLVATRLGLFAGAPRPLLPPAYQQTQIIGSDQLQAMVVDPAHPVQKVIFYENLPDVIVIGRDFKSFRVTGQADHEALKAQLKSASVDSETRTPDMVADPNGNVFFPLGLLFFILSGCWGALAAMGRGLAEMHSQQPATAGWAPTEATPSGDTPKAKPKIRFENVGGCDEALERCKRIVHFLAHPELFEHFGSEPPKGVLLLGPPGTGKTLLARATAGEVDAHILVVSGSEMVQMYVGVGASRIRELFSRARMLRALDGRPVIIFVDEIDAFGKQRGGSTQGGQEYDQTVNQLLTEMDGYTPLEGIIVMAATNLGAHLDSGLLRRFTYHVVVDEPDQKGRLDIFKIHTSGKKLAPDVSLEALARRTPGFVGDHIKKVVVEAATLAAIRQLPNAKGLKKEDLAKEIDPLITLADFDEAIDSIQYGDARLSKSRNQSGEERLNTAVHEIGHAVIPTELGGDPVTKISVMMRGMSLGMMQMHSETDAYGQSKKKLLLTIKTLLAGRIAQEIILETADTGASNDFERASKLARQMVGAFGMSTQLGFRTLVLDQGGFPVGNIGQDLSQRFNEGWSEIIDACESEVREIITKHRERILSISRILVEEESMLGDRFRELWAQEERQSD